MAESHVVSGLIIKRGELAGEMAELERRITAIRSGIASLDAAIKIFSPDYDLRAIKVKRARQRSRFFSNGEGQRLTLEAMRQIGGTAKLAEITKAIADQKSFGSADLQAVEHTIDGILRRAKASGLVKQVDRKGMGPAWQVVPLRQ